MKKYIIIIMILFASILFLFGCEAEEKGNIDDVKKCVIAALNAYPIEVEESEEEAYCINVANDVVLPKEIADYKGAEITWTSYDISSIDSDGKIVERDTRKIIDVDFECKITYSKQTIYVPFVFKLTTISLETACERFKSQLPNLIFDDRTFNSTYDKIINVSWTSSNEEVFSNEGKYIKPLNDTEIIITFIASDSNNKVEDSKVVKVQGKTYLDLFSECGEWLMAEGIKDTYITEDITLPSKYEGVVNLTWTSSNDKIIEGNGKIHKTYYEQYAMLKCRIEVDGRLSDYSMQVKIAALDTEGVSDAELIQKVISDIAVDEIGKRDFLVYGNINQKYNAIAFCGGAYDEYELITPIQINRPGIVQTSTEYITVHDTANNGASANAKMHAQYAYNGSGNSETSWHYSVDESCIYHQIPDNEVAYHAGDGRRVFGLVDTGIKATAVKPVVYIKNGTYHILGEDTKLRPYSNQEGTTFDTKVYTTEDINSLGIIVEIGENGNYFIGKTYYNTGYGLISNFGGNRNSISIESCVNSGSDYGHTYRNLALLCANLCIENNLSTDRIRGHHYFSGKPCPNSILTSGLWCDFLTLVAREKFVKEKLSNYTFNWSSLSNNIDDGGYISLSVKKGDVVKYKVDVKKGSNSVYSASFTTTIK